MKAIIYPHKMGSKGATALARALNTRKVFPNGRYNPHRSHVVINWGSGTRPAWRLPADANWLNSIQSVSRASNKLLAFGAMHDAGVDVPDFTTDRNVAQGWSDEGYMVVCRALLRASEGRGITIVEPRGAVPLGIPLYVKYLKKAAEYRVHVFRGEVIDVQQKRRRSGLSDEEVDNKVRNHDNGWVFCRDSVDPNAAVNGNSVNAVAALGLDFGAVDVIWNRHYQRAAVLEVNTAPGLEGTTLVSYVNAIRGVL